MPEIILTDPMDINMENLLKAILKVLIIVVMAFTLLVPIYVIRFLLPDNTPLVHSFKSATFWQMYIICLLIEWTFSTIAARVDLYKD